MLTLIFIFRIQSNPTILATTILRISIILSRMFRASLNGHTRTPKTLATLHPRYSASDRRLFIASSSASGFVVSGITYFSILFNRLHIRLLWTWYSYFASPPPWANYLSATRAYSVECSAWFATCKGGRWARTNDPDWQLINMHRSSGQGDIRTKPCGACMEVRQERRCLQNHVYDPHPQWLSGGHKNSE